MKNCKTFRPDLSYEERMKRRTPFLVISSEEVLLSRAYLVSIEDHDGGREERSGVRGHQGPCEVQALRVGVLCKVLLHLWISSFISLENRRKLSLEECLAVLSLKEPCWDVGSHDNSESNAPAGPACKSESLGEYRVRRDIQGDHDSGDQRWLALLRSLRIDRNHLTVLMVWYAWTWPKQSTR